MTQKDRGGARCALKKEWEDIFHSMPTILLCSVSSLQFSRLVLFNSLQPHGCQASLYITNSWSLLKLMSIELVMPSSHSSCLALLLRSSIIPSIRVFSNESALHIRWSKYWSFSFSISLSNEYSGLISFKMDLWISLQSKGSRVFSNTTFQINSSMSNLIFKLRFFLLVLNSVVIKIVNVKALYKAYQALLIGLLSK